jgi:hypothetical protein
MYKKIFFLLFISLFFPLFLFNLAKADESPYRTDETSCYYRDDKIAFCNLKNFQILGNEYAKDNIRVYYRGERLAGADTATFTHVDAGYARDRSRVYLDGEILPEANPSTIEYIQGDYARDGTHLFYKYEILAGFDPASFEIINSDYSKDKNFVYYRHEKIEDSHPFTFRLMADDYAKDLRYYYRYGQAIAKAANVFYERYNIKDLSDTCLAEMISLASTSELVALGNSFSKDELCVYFQADNIENSHAGSFEIIADTVAKDKNFVYIFSDTEISAVPYADAKSFIDLGAGYYKDK